MFGFGKKSKIYLAKRLIELSEKASDEFLNYIKNDAEVYNKCINDTPIKNTSAIYMMQIYTDMLNTVYDLKDVFLVVHMATHSSAPTQQVGDVFLKTMMDYGKQLREVVNYHKNSPDYDFIECVSDVFFALIYDNQEEFINDVNNELRNKVCYKKVYKYFDGVYKNSIILQEEYNMKKK